MHLLSAFTTNHQAVIGQLKMEKGENEITAALRLLEKLMKFLRDHWKIENNLHRTRDMAFDEDRSKIRKGNSPEVMPSLLNTLIQIAQKIKQPMAMIHHIG